MTDAFEERERLRGEIRAATLTGGELSARAVELRRQIAEADVEQSDNYARLARGQIERKQLKATNERRADLQKELAEVTVESQGALRGRRQAEAELKALYERELDAFAKEAEKTTQAARAAMEALRGQYVQARELWGAAQAAWHPLTVAVRERVEASFADQGMYPSRDEVERLSRCPPCPLPSDVDVFDNDIAPRPLGLLREAIENTPAAYVGEMEIEDAAPTANDS
ncbi:hypothetical protein SK069_14250 [Patulibacter brassicae]|uniref:Uncharacterized protein n=1 Tax=Patulibacter brassicae TaxID=1705717 RepID=A0ABU4VPS8_9ACTN|nr:hypothetical protein [Patulibacter brassicae]MDX8152765.1 hypothetical protein [Patulibacter brassicae]